MIVYFSNMTEFSVNDLASQQFGQVTISKI